MGELTKFVSLSHRQVIETAEGYGSRQFSALHRILAMAFANGAKTLVEEESPDEIEYAAEYKALFQYVTSYRDKKTPRRLHLFANDVPNAEALKAAPRYMGYLDLRPFNEPSICWAVLDIAILCGLDKGVQYLFVTCSKKYSHTVGGTTFEWRGFPYLQQEGVSVRCAQAALSIMSDYTGTRLPGPHFTGETALDSDTAAREIPSAGLTARQICIGIRGMGWEPLLYDLKDKQPPRATLIQLIYPYIESGLPVLMGIRTAAGCHALVAIGHTFTPDSWMSYSEKAYYGQPESGLSTEWVRRLVIQDDNFGPYTMIPTEELDALCFLVAVPLPPHVYLTADEAIPIAKYLLSPEAQQGNFIEIAYQAVFKEAVRQNIVFHPETHFWIEHLRSAAKAQNLVLRPRLVRGEDFIAEQAQTPAWSAFGPDFGSKIVIPEHVWRIEISWPQVFCHQRLRVGELVLDATHPWRLQLSALRQGWIWLRLPGGVLWHNVASQVMGCLCIPSDVLPEPHFKHE